MTKRRLEKVNEQLKREVSRILRREVHDPRVGLVTVTGVEVSGDLSVAQVYVRPASGEDSGWESMMEGLEAAASFVRRALGEDLHLRRIPELRFQEDHTLEEAMRIERILDEVLPEDEEGDADLGSEASASTEGGG
ncbi:MAG: 30S ribosome-binding factor RbfA [Gemmatimonadetes bacterium]|nr:30S ribosome-binding factor RbfA [Gemmatimonadota bacterium]NIR78718.1 30S ribosome-binding factor RbfA [Gemmatimonadota bacterium]NIT87357.1 30S ribosome-binding factor RbfA [Gemmatimonadota bacterium]NIU31201.1 30S ribosome-binding factor RbfA [Gemmatimonadota bacterium]NIV61561.1 30S ribosome-binding factor RbfA [Gemmatimonadota bacterium]